MSLDLQCSFSSEDGKSVLWEFATAGEEGKQQAFPIPGEVRDIPGGARVILRTRDGLQASILRAVPEAEEGADKVWAKAGALGDELVVQVLLKKQESGLWRAKKLVVTTQRGGGQGVVVPPAVAAAAKAASAAKAVGRPRVTCADEAAGDEMLECARYDELEDMCAILDEGVVPIDYQNAGLNTVLHYAAANGMAHIASAALDRGAASMPNSSGNTPLHWALQNKHVEVAKLIVSRGKGVDVLTQNAFGKSCVTEAFSLEDQPLAEMILGHPSAASLDDGGGEAGGDAGGDGAKVEEEEVDEEAEEAEEGSGEGMDCT
ncbi:hypothetical protein T484DRAFT_1954781 [Baffinella frigidus]|nr:hypothetical protein T484DRAFT_1954781 [Cryptophyta sp. CCMP2293]